MNKNWVATLSGILLAVGAAPISAVAQTDSSKPAATAQPVVLQGDVKLVKTVVENGVETKVLSEPKVVVPGDFLVFSTSYRNAGTAAVENFVVTNPLPGAVVLAAESAAVLDVSVDGGSSWGLLNTRTVSDGKGGTRPAQVADVTHVRWTLAVLQPGASGTLSYHAIVR